MLRRTPQSTRTYTLLPYTTLFRSARAVAVQRLEVVEAPGPVEAELLRELDAADHLVPGHPLLSDVESEAHGSHPTRAPGSSRRIDPWRRIGSLTSSRSSPALTRRVDTASSASPRASARPACSASTRAWRDTAPRSTRSAQPTPRGNRQGWD